MKVRVKFGAREFEVEDDTPADYDMVLDLANIGRQILLAPPTAAMPDEQEITEVTSRIELGFRGGSNDDTEYEDDEEDDDG